MGGRRSGSRDRSSPDDAGERQGRPVDPDLPEGEARLYPWWEWEDDLAGLDGPVRVLAGSLARSVAGLGEPPVPADVPADGREITLRERWDAVARLRRSLDRHQGSAPAEELAEARVRLDDVCGEFWTSSVDEHVGAVRQFVREVAHDLRSPLHSIIFLTDALFREESGPLNRIQKRQVSVVHSAAAALFRMSNDLLDFSGTGPEPADEGVAEIPFSPTKVVDDLENLLEPAIHHHKARLHTDFGDGESRVGDPQILNRILLNLASNALEAVGEDGTVRIRLRGDEEEFRAIVEDDSSQADPERLRELVRDGSYPAIVRRLDGHTRGLGLVICGRMIRAADGDLRVERTDDGWTRFRVTLPFPVLEPEDDERAAP